MSTRNMSLSERFFNWMNDKPVVVIPVAVGWIGYAGVCEIFQGLKYKFDLATRPLDYFQPQRPEAGPENYIYQLRYDDTKSLMNELPLQSLLNDLGYTPILPMNRQKMVLSHALLNFSDFPLQKQFIQYGLDDHLLTSLYSSARSEKSRSVEEGRAMNMDSLHSMFFGQLTHLVYFYQSPELADAVKVAVIAWAKDELVRFVAQHDNPVSLDCLLQPE